VLRAQLELGQVRQEIDRRIAEKEDEFNNSRLVLVFVPMMQVRTLDIPTISFLTFFSHITKLDWATQLHFF
jgi:hypothetical protein